MMNRLSGILRRIPKHIWILIIIVLVGIFFRVYHFSDWLLFKGDAFRDATLVSNAYRIGIESLPLLGPRAGGTMLHLGPVFYYFQYTAATLFQSMDAPVLAYPDLLFSILAVPIFYFFSRRYFSPFWSLTLAAMLAVSFLAIEYGRFAWNPNSTLFFTLIFSYAVLKIYDTKEELKNHRGWWASVAGITLAIASQLHFSAFLGLPIILILFVLLRFRDTKEILSPKIVFIFFVSVFLLYLPVILSDYLKHGENVKQFFSAISDKSSEQSLLRNGALTAYVFAKYYLRIGFGVVESGKALVLIGGALCLAGLFVNVQLARKELDKNKRNFLQWTLLMMVVYFVLYIPLAEKINRPRFFLPFMMMPYLYFGYVSVYLKQTFGQYPRFIKSIVVIGVASIIGGNIYFAWGWFTALGSAQITAASASDKSVKGKSIWLTWAHYERVATIVDASCQKQDPVFLYTSKNTREYDHSFEYAVMQKRSQSIVRPIRNYSGGSRGCYYYISLSNEKLPDTIASEIVDAPFDAGNVVVTHFYPRVIDETKNLDRADEKSRSTVFIPEKIKKNSRLYWGDIWFRINNW